MGLRIGTGRSATTLFAERQLSIHRARKQRSMERIASGRRINSAADDPAGFVLSQRLEARIRSTQQARRNTYDGLSVVQIGEAALGETSGLLVRIRELAVQSANGTLGDAERAAIGEEAEALLDEVDRIAQSTRFGRTRLLDGTTDLAIVSDADATDPLAVSAVDATRAALGLGGIDLGADQATSRSAFDALDAAIDRVASERGRLGTQANLLESRARQSLVEEENLRAANSRIVDADMAEETAELARAQLLEQTTIQVLVEERKQEKLILELLDAATEG